MVKYVLRRLVALPIVTFIVTSLLFLNVARLPLEQRAQIYMPSGRAMKTAEEERHVLEVVAEKYGLNDPLPVQYVRWLRNLVRGEWGYSPTWRQPVMEGLKKRVPATLELTLFALLPSLALALSLGPLAARRHRRLPDHLVRTLAFVGWAFPSFILGLLLMNVLYAWMGWFPPERISAWASPLLNDAGYRTYTGLYTVDALLNGRGRLFLDALRHLVLPGLTLSALVWALLTRISRAATLEVLSQEYIHTALAKGLHRRYVMARHVRPNALLPVISTAGVAMSTLLSSVVVVEVLFNFDGVGRWAVRAIQNYDVAVTTAFALFSCAVTIVTSLIADVLYGVVDPRVRIE